MHMRPHSHPFVLPQAGSAHAPHTMQQQPLQHSTALAAAAAGASPSASSSSVMTDVVPYTTGYRPPSPHVFDPESQLLNGPTRRPHAGAQPQRDDRESYIRRAFDIAHSAKRALNADSLAFSQVELDVINLHMRFDTSVAKLERHEAEHAQSIKDTADKCAQVQKMSSSLADSIAKRKPIIMQKTEELASVHFAAAEAQHADLIAKRNQRAKATKDALAHTKERTRAIAELAASEAQANAVAKAEAEELLRLQQEIGKLKKSNLDRAVACVTSRDNSVHESHLTHREREIKDEQESIDVAHQLESIVPRETETMTQIGEKARSYPELADIDFASLDQLISEMDSLAAAKKTRSQPEEQADPDFTAELDAEQKQQEQLKAKELDIQLNIRELEAETRVFEADAGPEASDMSVTASAVELLAEAKSGLETARDDLDPMRDEVLAAFDAPLDASRKHVHAAAARVKKMRKVVQNKKGANKSKTVFRAQKCKSAKLSSSADISAARSSLAEEKDELESHAKSIQARLSDLRKTLKLPPDADADAISAAKKQTKKRESKLSGKATTHDLSQGSRGKASRGGSALEKAPAAAKSTAKPASARPTSSQRSVSPEPSPAARPPAAKAAAASSKPPSESSASFRPAGVAGQKKSTAAPPPVAKPASKPPSSAKSPAPRETAAKPKSSGAASAAASAAASSAASSSKPAASSAPPPVSQSDFIAWLQRHPAKFALYNRARVAALKEKGQWKPLQEPIVKRLITQMNEEDDMEDVEQEDEREDEEEEEEEEEEEFLPTPSRGKKQTQQTNKAGSKARSAK